MNEAALLAIREDATEVSSPHFIEALHRAKVSTGSGTRPELMT